METQTNTEQRINQAIGELLIKEKYRFLPNGLISEIVRDFIKEVKYL
jgi:hypothetical protein